MARDRLRQVLAEAVADVAKHGFDSQERIASWLLRIDEAAKAAMTPDYALQEMLRHSLGSIYEQFVNTGVRRGEKTRYTIERVRPRLRAELDRRIAASASMIVLNRDRAMEEMRQRFVAWSSSVPSGGTKATDRVEVKDHVRKSIAQLGFAERRVLIDQGHKFRSSLDETVALGGGAIAGLWRSRWRQPGYDYREDHRERDGHYYAVRGCWALERGLMKAGPDGFTDQITKPAEEVFCRCAYRWVYALRDLPDDMLTARGRGELQNVRMAS